MSDGLNVVTARSLEDDVALIGSIKAIPTILDIVCRTTGMGFAAVARVTDERWIACQVRDDIGFGLQPGGELEVETTLCHEIRQSGQRIVIDDVASDPAFADHHTPRIYGLQSYISVPIRLADGTFFGTLCAIDPKPNQLGQPDVIDMFDMFADVIAMHLNLVERVTVTQEHLVMERETSALREEFIAVLGHDLRNPLASVLGGVRLLEREEHSPRGRQIIDMVRASARRMSGLVDNVLDFARGRLGGGLTLTYAPVDLETLMNEVVDELRVGAPDRDIELECAVTGTVHCDPVRIGQLVSNLVGNAIVHGAADKPIRLNVTSDGEKFTLWVANGGDPIPAAAMERLFQPFFRSQVRKDQQGLGLGLYIASEIATAHGGQIDVASTTDETRFTVHIPIDATGGDAQAAQPGRSDRLPTPAR